MTGRWSRRVGAADWDPVTAEVDGDGGAQSRGPWYSIPHGYLFTTRERRVASIRGWSAADA